MCHPVEVLCYHLTLLSFGVTHGEFQVSCSIASYFMGTELKGTDRDTEQLCPIHKQL